MKAGSSSISQRATLKLVTSIKVSRVTHHALYLEMAPLRVSSAITVR